MLQRARELWQNTLAASPLVISAVANLVQWYLRVGYRQSLGLRRTFRLAQEDTGLTPAQVWRVFGEYLYLVVSIPGSSDLLASLYPDPKTTPFDLGFLAYAKGSVRRDQVRRVWRREERPTAEEQALMVDFLGQYPNYALQTLYGWVRLDQSKVVRRERVFRLLGTGGGRLVDIGCSVNPWSADYGQRSRVAFGLDVSHISLRMAALLNPRDSGRLVCAQSESLPFADACLDRIVASEVLEHCVAPDAAIAEISRVLMPGGIAVVTVPMHVTDVQSLALAERKSKLGDATHRASFYSVSELAEHFEAAGLQVEERLSEPYHSFRLRKRGGSVPTPPPAAP